MFPLHSGPSHSLREVQWGQLVAVGQWKRAPARLPRSTNLCTSLDIYKPHPRWSFVGLWIGFFLGRGGDFIVPQGIECVFCRVCDVYYFVLSECACSLILSLCCLFRPVFVCWVCWFVLPELTRWFAWAHQLNRCPTTYAFVLSPLIRYYSNF